MTDSDKGRIWKIRTIKSYPEATNHLPAAKVLDVTDPRVRLHCRKYHLNGPAACQCRVEY